MALVLKDRVQEVSTTSGTGTLTLSGAVAGFQTFSTAIGNGNTTFYTIFDNTAYVWEVGIGTVGAGTLARTTVLSNSSGNTSPINLAGNSVFVWCDYPSEKSVNLDASGNVTPLGTIASGTWQGTTVGVSYGGTGVTASSGANSVVLRDANQNIQVNSVTQNLTSTVSAGGTTTLTPASPHFQILTGTTTQTFKLPDATSLAVGSAWIFDNDSTGNLYVTDNANGPLDTVAPGGYTTVFLETNGTVAGEWGKFGMIPSEVNWGTNSLDLGGSTLITNGTWNGTPIAYNYGGTGLTSFTGANNALYSTSASALTAGTLPVAAGGTSLTTYTTGDIIYASASNTLAKLGIGSTNQVLTVSGGVPTWSATQSTMVYPGAGIPNSTGSAWGTSYSTTGSGTVVALATSPSFTTPILGTPQSGDFSTGTFTWPTFNQNTTGSAATLTTPRAIYGNNFDGSAALTQIIASTYGGTGNGFTKFTGATTTEKTYTLPDSSTTILTTANAVTSGQGGTGFQTYTTGDIIYASATNTLSKLGIGSSGQILSVSGGVPAWSAAPSSGLTVGTTSITSGTSGYILYNNAGTLDNLNTTGSGNVVLATSPTLTTPILGTPTSGTLSSCTVDGTDSVGFRNIPVVSKSAAYTTVLSDAGKTILHPSTDANARTFTIDSNANVAYPVGTAITFINMTSQVLTIAITSDTMYLAGPGTTGSRSLAQYGMATAVKLDSTTWIISGINLT